MKAALWYGREDVRLEDIKEPEVTAGSVKIKVKWCGICGSDLHEYLGGPIFIPVHAPGGAAPCSCQGYYDIDRDHIKAFKAMKDAQELSSYLDAQKIKDYR